MIVSAEHKPPERPLMKRRMKILLVSPSEILNLLNWSSLPVGYHYELNCRDIPKDVEIVAVSYSDFHLMFQMILRHESFDVVPEGEELPRIYRQECIVMVKNGGSEPDSRMQEKMRCGTGQE
jgi:hypothetical protein